MKRFLLRSLTVALAALTFVMYYSASHARIIDLTVQDMTNTVQDTTKYPVIYSFSAIPLSTRSQDNTYVRDGMAYRYECTSHVVYSLKGNIGVAIKYTVSRNGTIAGTGKMTLPVTASDSSKLWVPLEDHLLASASLR